MKNQHAKQATTAIALFLMIAQRIYTVSATALNEVSHNSETESSGCPDGLLSAEAHHSTEGEGNFWVNLSVVLFCTCASGLMSGLTIGLAAIDRLALEVDAIGNREVKNMTERIFPVIDQHHWMLVTLLLCNACAMETLPIFLDRMVSPVAAIFISVSLVLVFGEVIPQAICTGPNQLTIAYWMCPLVLTLMWCTGPVSWPIARILDIWLGEHTFQRYDNDQLKKLVMLHSQQALGRINSHHLPEGIDGLTQDQARMIEGAITFQQEPCEEVMTKISKVTFTLTLDSIVTAETLNLIRDNGYSRIPIVETEGEQNTIIAFLLSKSLVGLEIKERKTLGELYIDRAVQLKIPLYLDKATTLGKMIKQFQQGHAHMAVVCNS